MNNEQKMFKVVCKKMIYSDYWVSTGIYYDMEIIYKIGKPSRAKEDLAALGYHLTVFSSMEYARDFKNYLNNMTYSCKGPVCILECNCIGVDIPHVPMIINRNCYIDKYNIKFGVWPTGTLMSEIVIPIRIVY